MLEEPVEDMVCIGLLASGDTSLRFNSVLLKGSKA